MATQQGEQEHGEGRRARTLEIGRQAEQATERASAYAHNDISVQKGRSTEYEGYTRYWVVYASNKAIKMSSARV
mgnify:CR=1 FL=1